MRKTTVEDEENQRCSGAGPVIETRLKHLEAHLEQENPVLLTTVQSFRSLDGIAYRMGLFNPSSPLPHRSPGGR